MRALYPASPSPSCNLAVSRKWGVPFFVGAVQVPSIHKDVDPKVLKQGHAGTRSQVRVCTMRSCRSPENATPPLRALHGQSIRVGLSFEPLHDWQPPYFHSDHSPKKTQFWSHETQFQLPQKRRAPFHLSIASPVDDRQPRSSRHLG